MDDATIHHLLTTVPVADSRELDRICEQAAKALIAAGKEPSFTVESADFDTDPFLITADRFWFFRFGDHPSVRTAAACAHWLARHVVAEHRTAVAEKWALGYAFVTKDSVESKHELAEATEDIVAGDDNSGDLAYFATLHHAGKLRSNFQFDELYQFLDSSLLAIAAGAHREDPLLAALAAFGAFGSRNITEERARNLYFRAWDAPGRTRHVLDVCVNALSAAAPFPDQGELLRDHAQHAVDQHPADHIFRFRLATGLHLCGQHDRALQAIDDALRLLPAVGSRGSHKLLQEQYLVQRNAIQEGRQRAGWTAEQQQRWQAQAAANDEIQHSLRTSGIRAIELVTVFTAAIAFTVGSLQITLSGTLGLADRLWLMLGLGIVLLVFALTIVGGTWFVTRHRSPHIRTRRTR
ncbi:MAG: hypothetical protein ACRDQB_06225 [Thermocrispum sp.]